jgi:FkbM family methyltransferase
MNNLEFKGFIMKHDVQIKGVIHVGAHFGQENELYNELGAKNKIFFEPLNSNFRTLVEKVGNEDGTILVKKALGNEKKQIEMFVESNNNGMSSSILEPKLHTRQFPSIVFDKKEVVEMDRLDDLDFDYSLYNMMNIDVQGYELEVLKGSIKTLKNIDYLVVEINSDELYQGCPLFEDIQRFLNDNGFTCIDQFWWGGNFGEGFFKKIK